MANIHEQTVVLIKPDGVRRGLIGSIISRFEGRGLKVVGLEMTQANEDQIDKHYPTEEDWIKNLGQNTKKTYQEYGLALEDDFENTDDFSIGKQVRQWTVEYLASGPIVKIVLEGPHAIGVVRKIIGETIPSFASPGTIRGDFSVESAATANAGKRAIYNLVHASGDKQEAEHEVDFWFAPENVFEYERQDYRE